MYLRLLLTILLVSLMTLGILPYNSADAFPQIAPSIPHYDSQQIIAHTSEMPSLDRASRLMNNQRYEEALLLLNHAIDRNPTSLVAVYNHGVCHFELAKNSTQPEKTLKHLAAAEESFMRAQTLNPRIIVIYYKLGKIALVQKQYEKARKQYQNALDVEPDNAVTHFNIAGVYDEEQRFNQAIVHYKKAIELDKDFIYAYNNLGLIYEAVKLPKEAESVYKKALERQESYNYARLNLGNLYAEQGKLDAAEKMYQQALKYEPENAWAHLYLGNIYFQNDEYEKAAASYRQSIERNPQYSTTYYLHAVSLSRLKRYDEALLSSLKYLNLEPHGRFSQQVLALILDLKLHQAGVQK